MLPLVWAKFRYLDEREAYADTSLSGQIWVDLNRIIRDMDKREKEKEAEIPLEAFVGYKFPDRTLRHKLWRMSLSNDALMTILKPLVTERFSVLRAPHFGALFGRLHHNIAAPTDTNLFESAAPSLSAAFHADDEPQPITIPDLRIRLDGFFTERVQPAFVRRDADAFRQAADDLLAVYIEEHHTSGAIQIAHAAALLLDIHDRMNALRQQWLAESQQKTQTLFGEPEATDLGHGCETVWEICERNLRWHYQTPIDTELAELALNVLSIVRADEAVTYPKLVEELNLMHFSNLNAENSNH